MTLRLYFLLVRCVFFCCCLFVVFFDDLLLVDQGLNVTVLSKVPITL